MHRPPIISSSLKFERIQTLVFVVKTGVVCLKNTKIRCSLSKYRRKTYMIPFVPHLHKEQGSTAELMVLAEKELNPSVMGLTSCHILPEVVCETRAP